MSDEKPLLEVHGLTKVYALGRMRFFGPSMAVQAVAGIDFCLGRNETLGLVGESGCGKSTTARILAGIEKPTSGSICFEGKELIGMSARKRKVIRPKIQMIFQDHDTSLNRCCIMAWSQKKKRKIGYMRYWKWLACQSRRPIVIRRNFPVVSAKESPLPAPFLCGRKF